MYGYDSSDTDGNLGLAIPAIGGAISTIGGLFGGSKDPGRFATNKEAYNAAINGNPPFKEAPSALNFLLQKSPVSKGGQGGWATSAAQNDAYAKYVAAKNIIGKQGTPTGQSYAQPSPLGGPVVAGLSTGPLLLAGAAALALVMLSKKR